MGRKRRQTQLERTVVAVGLTGGIGAGKSTALALFEKRGALTCSADELVHELYRTSEVASLVAEHFGDRVTGGEGALDRAGLAEAVKGDPVGLHWLEEAVHPLVREEMLRRIAAAPLGSIVVCEVPLLFETGFESLFDLVVTIEASAEVRRERSTHEFGMEQFTEFEALQASSDLRVAESDLVFVNDGDLAMLEEFIDSSYQAASRLLFSEHPALPPNSGQKGRKG